MAGGAFSAPAMMALLNAANQGAFAGNPAGALSGLQSISRSAEADRAGMLGMAEIGTKLQALAMERQQWLAQQEAARRQQEAIEDYASRLPPEDRALLLADPENFLQNATQDRWRDPWKTINDSLVNVRAEGGPQSVYQAPMTPYQAAQVAAERDRIALAQAEASRPAALPNDVRMLQAAGMPVTMENLLELRRSGATNINMGDKAATAGAVAAAQAEAKAGVDRKLNIGQELADTEASLANAEGLLSLSDQAPSGPLAKPLSVLDKAVEAVTGGYGGIGVDSAAADELNSRLSREALNAAQQLAGTVSDSDMRILQEAAGGGWTSAEGRERVFEIMRKGYDKRLQMLRAEQEAFDKGATATEAKRAASRAGTAPQGNRIRYDANGNRLP